MSLKHRSMQAERMDTDCADYEDYRRCLHDLSRVNVVTLTHRPTLAWLSRHAGDAEFSLLDVASGYGDALRAVRARFPQARLTGIDLNPWATRAAQEGTPADARITFINGDAFAWRPDQQFDFVISSQFTHHLTDEQVVTFLAWLGANATKGWFISDIQRHWMAYYGFPVLARAAGWHRLVREDGQISIARGFIRREWEGLLRQADVVADITWHIPFRLCVGTR